MKLFFADSNVSALFHPQPSALNIVKKTIVKSGLAEETDSPHIADAIIIQESNEYKDWRYPGKLLNDKFISTHLTKIFTISLDDSATGLFRGLYTSMPKGRFDQRFHRAVPYIHYSNDYVFTENEEKDPTYLAGWYGNTKSNIIRKALVGTWQDNREFIIKHTHSWYNHNTEEQRDYVELIKSAKFSLCPAGWAPASPRIYESMALGRCPVIIADEFSAPLGPQWHEFALFYPQKKNISGLLQFLRENEPRYKELGSKARENWNRFFEGDLLKRYYVDTLLTLIRDTPHYTKEMEVKRWKSFATIWSNRWTLSQRVVNKCKLLFENRN